MEDCGHLVDPFTHVPTSRSRDIWSPVFTSLLNLIVFDTVTSVLDQWKHLSLVGRLVRGEEGREGMRYFQVASIKILHYDCVTMLQSITKFLWKMNTVSSRFWAVPPRSSGSFRELTDFTVRIFWKM